MTESMTDQELLREFASNRSEDAFQALVKRHVDLVFATAMRGVNNETSAREVSQNVFLVLARRASDLRAHNSLAGWLHKTTLLETRQWWRGELRRQRRESTAMELGTTLKEDHSLLQSLAGVLDEGLLELQEADREALLLRFFQEKSHREIGGVLGTSDDAARKRIEKALDRLTEFFRRRGYAVPAVAVTASALQGAVQAAPFGLAGTISAAVILSSATVPTTAVVGTATVAMTVLQKVLLISGLFGIGIATSVFLEHRSEAALRAEVQLLRAEAGQVALLQADNERLSGALANGVQARPDRELLQLRGETGVLRRRTNDLRTWLETNRRTNEMIAAQTNGQSEGLPLESWTFRGYETPEDTFQSSAWAVREKNIKAFLDCLTPVFREEFKNTATVEGLNGIRSFDTKVYEVVAKDEKSENEVQVHISYTSVYDRSHVSPILMRKVDGKWKLALWKESELRK